MIRTANRADAEAIARIYGHYVRHSVVTFETEPPGPAEIADRMGHVAEAGLPWLVVEVDGALAGYAYATRWRVRPAYRFAAEITVYIDPDHVGRGLGYALYERLFAELRNAGMHALIGGIALPNPGSIALHEKMGMTKVAHFAEVGQKFGRWVDVGYWQCVL
jgi:phosphinothricin acetyltransferase